MRPVDPRRDRLITRIFHLDIIHVTIPSIHVKIDSFGLHDFIPDQHLDKNTGISNILVPVVGHEFHLHIFSLIHFRGRNAHIAHREIIGVVHAGIGLDGGRTDVVVGIDFIHTVGVVDPCRQRPFACSRIVNAVGVGDLFVPFKVLEARPDQFAVAVKLAENASNVSVEVLPGDSHRTVIVRHRRFDRIKSAFVINLRVLACLWNNRRIGGVVIWIALGISVFIVDPCGESVCLCGMIG